MTLLGPPGTLHHHSHNGVLGASIARAPGNILKNFSLAKGHLDLRILGGNPSQGQQRSNQES
jgi:hypothetical protein